MAGKGEGKGGESATFDSRRVELRKKCVILRRKCPAATAGMLPQSHNYAIMIDETLKKKLEADNDGLSTFEYIANHIDSCAEDMDFLITNMDRADRTGQFVISAARYLFAIDPRGFDEAIDRLVAMGIDKDREHRYIGALMEQFYGADYADRADELSAVDNNFRRIYKRLFPQSAI